MTKIDLHIHSCFSDDGEFPVREILTRCLEAGVTDIAIADHNTVKAVAEAMALAPGMGITVTPGVELDCVHLGRNFHLLGYHFDYTNPVFEEIGQDILEQEQKASRLKLELIRKELNIPLSTEEVLGASDNGVVTGELIAEILLCREDAGDYEALRPYLPGGSRSDNPYVNFYWDYFSQGKPAYVPIEYISLQKAVDTIHGAGGIAVLAHPGQNLKGDYGFLGKAVETRIDGIEAYSSYHTKEDIEYFVRAAEEYGLIVTCGSDFHGKTKPSIKLCGHMAGEAMPSIAEAFYKACAARD